jgi:hypothetical protein
MEEARVVVYTMASIVGWSFSKEVIREGSDASYVASSNFFSRGCRAIHIPRHATVSTMARGMTTGRNILVGRSENVIKKPWITKRSDAQINNACGRLQTMAVGWKP